MSLRTFLLPALLAFLPVYAFAQSFVPRDTIIGSNFFQVEFSTDGRSMVWCEQIPLSGGKAKVWYADMDLVQGLPDLAGKQLIDTIQGQGWPYWGHDLGGRFFILQNQHQHIKYVRRLGINTLDISDFGTVNADARSLLNVSSDSTKPYFWINYTVLSSDTAVRDSLFAFRSDNPGARVWIAAEKRNTSGSAFELTFPRWLAQSEVLAYPFRPVAGQPYWDIKFWDGTSGTSRQVTNDIVSSIFNHHVDDLPFRLPQFPGDTFLFSSKAASQLAIYQNAGTFFTRIQLHSAPTQITPPTLTSFEPFTINGNQTYGAYQVYAGGGIPGTTSGEIYLKGIFGDTLHVRVSAFSGDVAVDPEYVVGTQKVWIYYYGKPVGPGLYNLHRCETPLVVSNVNAAADAEVVPAVTAYPNPFTHRIQLAGAGPTTQCTLHDLYGRCHFSGPAIQGRDFSALPAGTYLLGVQDAAQRTYFHIKLQKLE